MKLRVVAGQEGDGGRDLLRLGEPAHRDVHEPAGGALGVLREQLLSSGVFTGPGQSALTRTPWRANCTPSSRVIASTPPLLGGVGDLRGRRAHRRDERRRVDDRALALREHVRQHGLAAEVDRGQVDLLDPAPGVEPGVEDRVVVRRRDPGVVERDVDPAVRLVRLRVDPLVVLRAGDVRRDEQPAELVGQRLPGLGVEVDRRPPWRPRPRAAAPWPGRSRRPRP